MNNSIPILHEQPEELLNSVRAFINKNYIEEEMAVNYVCDKEGTALNFKALSDAIGVARACGSLKSSNWKEKIDADFEKRGQVKCSLGRYAKIVAHELNINQRLELTEAIPFPKLSQLKEDNKMPRGVIYVMSTAVSGLFKIGSTNNFESRMSELERHGYRNVSGLKRFWAIEVDDYENREKILHGVLSGSKLGDTELFSISEKNAKGLMLLLEGKQIFPKVASSNKDDEIKNTSEQIDIEQRDVDGEYAINARVKNFGSVEAKLLIKNGNYTLCKGSLCAPLDSQAPSNLKDAKIEDNRLVEDFVVTSPSNAAYLVIGHSSNGRDVWKNADGLSINELLKAKVPEDE